MVSISVCRALHARVRGMSGPDAEIVQLPECQTLPASNVTNSTAQLNGTFNNHDQDAEVRFEYGGTTAYGKITPIQMFPATQTPQAASAGIKGLSASTTYHARIRISTEAGTVVGNDIQFTTYPIAGINPSVVGSPPVATTIGASDFQYDAGSNKVSCTLTATCDAGTHALSTTATIGIKQAGTGAGYFYFDGQSFTTTSTSPVTFTVDTGYTLPPSTNFQFVCKASNVKGEVISDPPSTFTTPDAPPPVGLPPTAANIGSSQVTSTTAAITVEVNNVNTAAGTGHTDAWIRYKTGAAPASATDYQVQVGPINLTPITGNTTQTLTQTLTGLTASTAYHAWGYAANPYGDADTWNASPISFTTGAPGQLPTITVSVDSNWVAYGQATVFCKYTTPAGTWQVQFGYRVNGSGGAFTYTSLETVPNSTSEADWDAIIADLAADQSYEITARITDGVSTVSATTSAFLTTAQGPSNISATGFTSNFPGKGPGSRGSTAGPLGQSPTVSDIPTYADPRRPSSGLISNSNRRKYIPNIAASPLYAAANLAAFAAYPANNGYDIVVYGPGHGVGGRSNYDIEVWDPQLCTVLSNVTGLPFAVPLVLPNTLHGKGSAAANHALKAYSRWGDVVGLLGSHANLRWCGSHNTSPSTNLEICWATQVNTAKVIVGVSVVGIQSNGLADSANTGAPGLASRIGAICNVYHKRLTFTQGASNYIISPKHNTGTNDGNWNFLGAGGLCGFELNLLRCSDAGNSGYGTKSGLRSHSATFRWDIRENDFQHQKEHPIYVDNVSPLFSGVENGVAAESYFIANISTIGLIDPATGYTGSGKNPFQLVARKMDNSASSPFKCPTGCNTLDCADNVSIGPDGMGDVRVYDNLFPQDFSSGTFSHLDYAFVGHGGTIHFRCDELWSGVGFFSLNSCSMLLRPHVGPDGYVYGTVGAIVERAKTTYNFTQNSKQNTLIQTDGVGRLEVQNVVVPAGFTKPILEIGSGEYGTQNTSQWYQGQCLIPLGFVKVTMANPLSGWAGWPGGTYTTGEVRFGYNNGSPMNIPGSDPPIVGRLYTAADVDTLYDGVCRQYLPNPTTQPVGFVCPNA